MQISPISYCNNNLNFKMSNIKKKAIFELTKGIPVTSVCGYTLINYLPHLDQLINKDNSTVIIRTDALEKENFKKNTELITRIDEANDKLLSIKEYKEASPKKNVVNRLNIDLIERLTSDPLIYNNENIRKNLDKIIREINNSENNFYNKSTSVRCSMAHSVLDLYTNNPKIQESEVAKNNIGSVLASVLRVSPDSLELVETWLTDDELFNDADYTEALLEVLQEMEPGAEFSKKYLSSVRFYKNKSLKSVINNVISNIHNEQQAKELCKTMNVFLSDTKYYENPKVINSLGTIILNYGKNSERAAEKMESTSYTEKREPQDILDELDDRYKKAIKTKFLEDRVSLLKETQQFILDSLKVTEDENFSDFLHDEYFRIKNDINDIIETK